MRIFQWNASISLKYLGIYSLMISIWFTLSTDELLNIVLDYQLKQYWILNSRFPHKKYIEKIRLQRWAKKYEISKKMISKLFWIPKSGSTTWNWNRMYVDIIMYFSNLICFILRSYIYIFHVNNWIWKVVCFWYQPTLCNSEYMFLYFFVTLQVPPRVVYA